jgi:hypothetical protein
LLCFYVSVKYLKRNFIEIGGGWRFVCVQLEFPKLSNPVQVFLFFFFYQELYPTSVTLGYPLPSDTAWLVNEKKRSLTWQHDSQSGWLCGPLDSNVSNGRRREVARNPILPMPALGKEQG